MMKVALILLFFSEVYSQCGRSSYYNKPGFCLLDEDCCIGIVTKGLCGEYDDMCCYGTFNCRGANGSQGSGQCPSIRSRKDWRALSPIRRVMATRRPVDRIIIHHTNDGKSCFTDETCRTRVKSLQSFHQRTKKWSDIAWNFVIGGNGQVYEGIGWGREGFHTLNWNSKSLGVAFIGNYERDEVSSSMVISLQNLISCGVKLGHLSSNYQLHGHKDARNTSCPGRNLYLVVSDMNGFQPGPIQ